MPFWGIFRFELGYQLRRPWPWLFFLVLLVVDFMMTRDGALAEALYSEFFVNSPFAVAKTMVFGSLLWLLLAPPIAGEAAARDVATGMYPLVYTTPIRRTDYLGGRLLAALVINLGILLAVPIAILLGVYLPGVDAALLGPFRPAAFITGFAFIVLPNAIAGTTLQFWFAARSGRAMASYVASLLLVFMSFFVASLLLFGRSLGTLLDPIGIRFIWENLSHLWTTHEKSWRLLTLEGALLGNRLLWLGIALVAAALTWLGFRFAHRADTGWWSRWRRRRVSLSPTPARTGVSTSEPASIPKGQRTFGFAIEARKMVAIALDSFRTIAISLPGLALLVGLPVLTVLVVLDQTMSADVPMVPTTALVVRELTGALSDELSRWVIVPLLIVFFAGELVWREREAGVAEITDAAPGSDWAPFVGKLIGLALVLALFMVLLALAGIVAQVVRGHRDFELGLYARILLGLQLTDYLLFSVLALAVHVLVNQKYVAHLVAILVYVFILVLATMLGIEHNLLVYGAAPGWSYTEMRGFGPSIGPWLWFKLYWASWALLLAVGARLLWVRGKESRLAVRIRIARGRLVHATAWVAGAAVVLIIGLGGFIFYNTNILNEYYTASDIDERRAEYERRYRRHEKIPQPVLSGARLNVDIFPKRRAVSIRGSYRLLNASAQPIDSVHVAPATSGGRMDALTFDRRATLAVNDADHGYRIYALETPLQPGDTMRLDFEVHVEPRGFREAGVDPSVQPHGSSFTSGAWFPFVGYQRRREIISAADRREHGLEPRAILASLYESEGREPPARGGGIEFEAVVGTDEDQVAVAPGALRRTWSEGGRRYFHYSTDAPIGSDWAFFSARYAVREGWWKDVAIRIHHHPDHTAHLGRVMRGVQASLDYNTTQFGPYPYRHLTVVEQPGAPGAGMHAEASMISHGESFARWVPEGDARLDFPYAVVAHEMAHQWTLPYALVEGLPFLSEGLAWFVAMQVVKESRGIGELRQLLSTMRTPELRPEIRRGEPLLRALDPYLAYRKGPFAMYALTEYVGSDRVNLALRRLIARHDSAGAPLATTLHLYRELQAVTPDSLRYLLHALFEVNTYWELQTRQATAVETPGGTWEVTLTVRARKLVFDSAGVETELPLDEWFEIGVFAAAAGGGELGAPIYLQKHRIRTGEQTITVRVSRKPVLAGIDPFHLLDLEELADDDNIEPVKIGG